MLKKSIPTASFVDVQSHLKDTKARFPNTFPSADTVKELMGNMGVNKSDNIVLYGQVGSVSGPTRAHFILSAYGFPNIKILDGGLVTYMAANLPTVPGEEYKGEKSVITDLTCKTDEIADFKLIHEFAQGNFLFSDYLGKQPDYQLIDLRLRHEFTGEKNTNIPGCRVGHVPGAIHISVEDFYHHDTQTLKTVEELEELLHKHRVDKNKKIIAMCKTGISASVGKFLLSEFNFKDSKIYDGSWSEYGTLTNKQ